MLTLKSQHVDTQRSLCEINDLMTEGGKEVGAAVTRSKTIGKVLYIVALKRLEIIKQSTRIHSFFVCL